ncbi:LYZ2 domain-containing protein [Burkholderia diffusa]|uniref:glycoside hydrolase family 73 protein n=1 Tax=Burkholderia diffusa TaxID=488732 RepID=UPI001CB0C32D|nr:glycoside hydrolase family 73 protein [Burkholderia diffusa]CAG9245768.1 LYZ2 domain-containing protein [Burkholderia diffusa]
MLNEILAWLLKRFGKKSPPDAPQPTATPSLAPPQSITSPAPSKTAETVLTASPPVLATPAAFIEAIAPAARDCMRRTRVPASVTVAQAALESNWGKRTPGFNLFGIKADTLWHGPTTADVTHEVVHGQRITITAHFRAYDDWQGSIDDHAAFLAGNPRYAPAFACKSGPDFAKAIAKAGYATDPQYADKLIAIMTAHRLMELDV